MARSNTGGTRGFLRGKVANDLYQVTVQSNGKRIQLVRAVEESRANPNTVDQAVARMRMALLMGALKDLKAIVDHSWETIPYGQLSIAHFVQLNMPLVISDCFYNWSTGNKFIYPSKGTPEVRAGSFIVAEGTLALPAALYDAAEGGEYGSKAFEIRIGKANATFGDLKASLGLNAADYMTFLDLNAWLNFDNLYEDINLVYHRLYIASGISDTVAITQGNVYDLFTHDGNVDVTMAYNAGTGTITVTLPLYRNSRSYYGLFSTIIISRWDGIRWCRNNARFAPFTADYDIGADAQSPRMMFQSWYPSWDPDGPTADVYPARNPFT